MLTIFAVPKPFIGHIDLIQRNAIRSWLALDPPVEILLLGKETGIADVAAEYHLTHIPEIERNRFNTPTVSSAFEMAQKGGIRPIMAYVNADIILTRSLFKPLKAVPFQRFLMSCQRWDLEVDKEIDFAAPNWEDNLGDNLNLHAPCGMDVFIFPRGLFCDLPPLGIGRAKWDSWLVYWTLKNRIPVIDVTRAVWIYHQNHDYSHHPLGEAGVHAGPEVEWNLRLAGGNDRVFTLEDADWTYDETGFKPAATSRLRKIQRLPAFYPATRLPVKALSFILNRLGGMAGGKQA
jgi:hypothetical protein